MRKRRWMLILVVLVVAAAAYSSVGNRAMPGRGLPFADLDKVLAGKLQNGWEVEVSPQRPGPYRLNPTTNSPMVPKNTDSGMTYRIRGADGVPEEVQLKGAVPYDQAILELETEDGHRTLVVLKRTK